MEPWPLRVAAAEVERSEGPRPVDRFLGISAPPRLGSAYGFAGGEANVLPPGLGLNQKDPSTLSRSSSVVDGDARHLCCCEDWSPPDEGLADAQPQGRACFSARLSSVVPLVDCSQGRCG
jgi:hypothetical protein